MKTQYDPKEWAAGTTQGRHVFNYKYRMLGRELKGWELLKTVPRPEGRNVSGTVYLWQKDPGREMVNIAVVELPQWRDAQRRLLEELGHSMRPEIPQGTGKFAGLGDVNFIGRDPQSDVPAAINFTRGNMCVSVHSVGEKAVDISAIASELDRTLSVAPAPKGREKRRLRVPTPMAVKAGRSRVVINNLPKAAHPHGWLKVVAPDGELRRKGNTLMYISS